MTHRDGIRQLMIKTDLEGLHVHDWGRGTKPITDYLAGTPKSYIGVDKREDVGADIIIDFSANPAIRLNTIADVAFCIEVLEHTQVPMIVLDNIWENLKIGGVLILTVPFLYPMHSTEDYWRFTDQCIEMLLRDSGFVVDAIRSTGMMHEIMVNGKPEDLDRIYAQGWFVKAHKPERP